MAVGNIFSAKENSQTAQPLLLCELTLRSGTVKRYSTHPLSSTYGGSPSAGSYQFGGNAWLPRVLNQDIGATQAMSDLGVDLVPQVSITLADPDKSVYAIEVSEGFKGATLKMYAVMWDIGDETTGSFSSNSPAPIKFIGTCNSPSFDDRSITISATSLLNMTQIQIPPLRIQPLCSWLFPTTDAKMDEAVADESSPFYQCGYSYGRPGGVGNPESGTAAFRFCSYDLDACIARLGDEDALVQILQDQDGHPTGRFGGFRYIPDKNGGLHRPYVTGQWEQIINASNEARYGDYEPMCYGTTWVQPLVMGVWGDGNYTGFEVLLSYGEVSRIKKVVVNGEEIQQLAADYSDRPSNHLDSDAIVGDFKNGFWITVNTGQRNGTPNTQPGWGSQGDPYGSTAAIYINVLRQVASEGSVPEIQVLLEGAKIRVYSDVSTFTKVFTSNPVWVLLDLLTWATWRYTDIDLQSFIDAAAKCDETIYYTTMGGYLANWYPESGAPPYKRYSVGFALRQRTSIGELVRGLRNAMKAMLFFDYNTGLLKLRIKETLASQQPSTVTGSNYDTAVSSVTVAGSAGNGYVAYKFDEGSILKDDNNKIRLNVYQRTNQDAANKCTVVFQNRENQFSQDSATIVDTEDVARLGFEVAGSFNVQGPQTFDHVRRIVNTWFAENYRGNPRLDYTGSAIGDTGGTIIFEVETSVKALHLMVGDLCLFSNQQLGISNQLVRVMAIQPSTNFETCKVTLSWHNDNWYQDTFGQVNQPKYARTQSLVDRKPFALRADYETPMSGDAYYDQTDKGFGIEQFYNISADGSVLANLRMFTKVPVNVFPTTPGRPRLEVVGVGSSGGGYPTDKTYYVALSSKSGSTSASPVSAVSRAVAVSLNSPDASLNVEVQDWPDSPCGYFAFAGESPLSMCYQSDSTATPATVTLINTFKKGSWGPPDEAFSKFRWKVNHIQHSGVWGAEVVSCTTATITIAVFPGYGFATNEWAGRVVSVLGIAGDADSQFPRIPIANLTVASNNTNTLTFSAGNPTTCVQGGTLKVGDVVVMRYDPTFGEDATGKYFEDAKAVNVLGQLGPLYKVAFATNANPIVVTLFVEEDADFPFADGDIVVVQDVEGNTAANSGWTVSGASSGFSSVELNGSLGNGTYTSGGTIAKQVQGMTVDAEKGNLAFIIAGTGRGTYAKIKSNTATRCYIDGDWPVNPDSTSQLIVVNPTPIIDKSSDKIANAVPQLSTSYDLDVHNFNKQVLLVRGSTQSTNGDNSPDVFDPFREVFVFGAEGTGDTHVPTIDVATNVTLDPIAQTVQVDTTAGNVTVTLPQMVGWIGLDIMVVKVSSDANEVTWQVTSPDTVDGETSGTLSDQWEHVTIRAVQ